MSKISLCIIVKDDSELVSLKRGVSSCVKFVNEVCITATNKPCHKIEKWCKKEGYKYSFFKWTKDFAAARNFNFDQASYHQFWIDSDDVVVNAEILPEIAEMIEEGKVDWVSFPYLYAKDSLGRVQARQVKPRLTRKGTGKWNKTVHECYEPTKAITHSINDLVVIDHLQKEGHDQSSLERNLDILMAEYKKDGDKTDPRTLFYIAQTLLTGKIWNAALEFYTKFIPLSGSDDDKYFAYHSMTDCFYMIKNLDAMVDAGLQMIKIFPQWSLGYFDVARAYSLKGDHHRVIEWTLNGLEKTKPETMNFTNDLDYTVMPLGRLADAYLMTGNYYEAMKIAEELKKDHPKDPLVKELYQTCQETIVKEKFVKSFVYTADMIRREDRLKAIKLFECIPNVLDSDIRIQQMRSLIVPPKNWEDNSIVIYCGKGNGENWAYPSIYTGIGGSEEMVIRMSEELTKLGHKVTVYNNCGEMNGVYDGVEYKPFYHFDVKDNFNILIAWRIPALLNFDIKAKKKLVWLHDIAYPQQFNDKIIKNTDKFIFLSRWHRNNMPLIPEEKIFISNNGIVAEDYAETKEKKPNSLLWTSSPDRGLLPFVKNIWPLIKKEIPDVTLDYCYGWQNIDRELYLSSELRSLKEELVPLLKQEGIIDHGRLSHAEVAELYKTCQVLAYASEFGETNNISSQKAQASGCYVITTPQAGGTPEYLKFGELVDGKGIYTDKDQQKAYAKAVINYLRQPREDESVRKSIVGAFSVKETAKSWQKGLL